MSEVEKTVLMEQVKVTAESRKKQLDVYLDGSGRCSEEYGDFVTLRSRKRRGEAYTLAKDGGVVLTEKAASLLGVQAGDHD